MASHVVAGTFGMAWDLLILEILNRGKEVSPRGQKTKEVLNVCFEVRSSLHNVLVNEGRDLNYRFMVAEWLWIMAGLNEVDTIAKYNSNIRQFSDDGQFLSGAYGPRLMPQMDYVMSNLQNSDSRQAVATIWTPSPQSSKDIPCTISLHWYIREDLVHCTANMRSSDAWLGLPYDFFVFSQIQNYIAAQLGRESGSLTMNLASSHLYAEHWYAASSAVGPMFDTKTFRSPQLSADYTTPHAGQLTELLQTPGGCIDELEHPWSSYALALTQGKKEALEVLRGLEPAK